MNRSTPAFEATTATTVRQDGIDLLAFQGCGYLGLAHDERVIAAAQGALARYGASGLASRGTSGNLDLHERLEEQLAEWLDVEAAVVCADGYLADIALVAAVAAPGRVALHDSDAHPSLLDAARLADLPRYPYGEGDMMHATALLDRFKDAKPIVLTDGAFGMHGRLAPANELLRYLPTSGLLVLDDSHGVGVLGARGRGTIEAFGLSDPRLVVTGSLGKALGSGGGFIAGAAEVVSRVRSQSQTFLTTTALSPPLAAAASTALEILDAEPERLERLRANTGQLHRSARRVGLGSTGTFLPVLRIPFDAFDGARRLAAALHVEGLFAPAIRYPSATSAGVVRIAVCSEHTAEEIRRLEDALVRHLPDSSAG